MVNYLILEILIGNFVTIGIEWTCYASEILYQENIDHRVFLKENAVFEAALSVWLALHEENELNGLEKLDFDDSFERFEANFSHKFMIFKKSTIKISDFSLKTTKKSNFFLLFFRRSVFQGSFAGFLCHCESSVVISPRNSPAFEENS